MGGLLRAKGWWQGLGLSAALTLASLLALAAPAGAVPTEELLQIPRGGFTLSGEGAGQLENPRGIATDPVSGHLFVADLGNDRISEFTSWGAFVGSFGWGVADGSPELQSCGPAEPEAAPDRSLCRPGLQGDGAGQFLGPWGIARDAAGNLYVVDSEIVTAPLRTRVQKFSPEGEFLLMFGGEVNETTKANLCTKADLQAGEECGGGILGTGPGQFATSAAGTYITIGPDGTVYVGDVGRIQEFNPDGTYKGEIALEGELAGKTVKQLAADGEGDLYAVLSGEDLVRKLSPAGALLASLAVEEPGPLAVDVEDNLYAVEDPAGFGGDESEPRVLVFDAAGAVIVPGDAELARPAATADLQGLATNVLGDEGEDATTTGDLYASYFNDSLESSYVAAFGPEPRFEPAPEAPATIGGQYATAVGPTEATLGAEINPHFFGATTYYVEYGTGKCSEGGCTQTAPAPPGTALGVGGDRPAKTSAVALGGLQANTTYHYRFVAVSGPFTTRGSGEGEDGGEASFTTRIPHTRVLPDGRAYEMVSPPQKNNADLPMGSPGLSVAPLQASPDGEAITYAAFTAFADPQSSPGANQYISRRGAGGWSTQNITPPDEESYLTDPLRGFSEDLSKAAVVTLEPPLLPEAAKGFHNLYAMDTASEAVALASPGVPQIQIRRLTYCVDYAGASADFSRIFFAANGALREGDPVPPFAEQTNLYEWSAAEGLRLVSVLPNGNPAQPKDIRGFGDARHCRGTPAEPLRNAISADGSKAFWSAGGRLYARIGGEGTVQLDLKQGGPGPSSGGVFRAASADGSKVFFTSKNKLTPAGTAEAGSGPGDLYRYDFEQPLGARLEDLSTKGILGVLGASEDGEAAYFASEAVLDAEPGPAGESAQAGEPNVYLWRAGQGTRFIATLSDTPEASGGVDLFNWRDETNKQTARVSPDGRHLVFVSIRPLTGYDNTDQETDKPAAQIFLYDAEAEELRCASCNPTGARPLGPSRVPVWSTPYQQPRYLSDDGTRVFFESPDSLEEADTNATLDVYEFELSGAGSCTAQSPTYVPASGGCIYLLSSGKPGGAPQLLDASAEGEDVFIAARQRLVPRDEDENADVYDVRVGGFEPPLPPPPVPCAGEACRGAVGSPPPSAPPGTAVFQGPGDPKPITCKKPKRKVRRGGKVRCVKPKPRHHKQRRHRQAHRRNSR
jgi:DNA-binding beta-propeller fold protein YncE/Tol biopolymer transport system component